MSATRLFARVLRRRGVCWQRRASAFMRPSLRATFHTAASSSSSSLRPGQLAFAGAFAATLLWAGTPKRPARCYDVSEDEIDAHFHLSDALDKHSKKVDAKKMLKMFIQMQTDTETPIDVEFLSSLFHECGIQDRQVAESIFQVMDWNKNGKLEPEEVAAVLTLFQQGDEINRFKFLFRCIDLDHSGKVDKDEFRRLLTAVLEAKYHLKGLSDPLEPDEWFAGITPGEYHTTAKLRANKLVRNIFNFADQNRDGELNMKEFLHWCKRGGVEVEMIKTLLLDTIGGLE